MPSMELNVRYRFFGSDAQIAAFTAWLMDQLPDPEHDGVMELARHLGLVLEEYTTDANTPISELVPAD
jgi:hypothetical protein